MKQISNWTATERQDKMAQLHNITKYNRQHFFSDNFFNQILSEFKLNLSMAITEFNNTKNCSSWLNRWEELLSHQSAINFLKNNKDWGPTPNQLETVYKEAKKYIK